MNNEGEIDLIQAIKICLKKKNILLLLIMISIVLGVIYTLLLNKPMYKSSSKILIDRTDTSISQAIISNDIIQEVSNSLNIKESYVAENIISIFDKNTKIISVEVSSEDNKEAFGIINKYQEILKDKLELTYGIKVYNVIEQPQISNDAYNIDHIKDMMVAFSIGIVVCGVYCIFIVTVSGNDIYSEVENIKVTLLGKINKEEKEKTKVKLYVSENSKIISQMKKLMANIELSNKIPRPNSILVTGTNYGVGSTYVVSNLAIPYQKAGKKVLIIDSNFKNGIEDKIFSIKSEVGLTDLIELEDITKEDVLKAIKQTKIKNIHVLTSGNTKIEEEMLISNKTSKIVDVVKDEYDIILIDGEPITKKITAYGWSNAIDATVIVAEYGKTKIDEIQKAKKIVEEIGGKVSGVVVNKAE